MHITPVRGKISVGPLITRSPHQLWCTETTTPCRTHLSHLKILLFVTSPFTPLAQCPFSPHSYQPLMSIHCSPLLIPCLSHFTSLLFRPNTTPTSPCAPPLKIEAAACNSPHPQTDHEAGALPADPQSPDDGLMSEPAAATVTNIITTTAKE